MRKANDVSKMGTTTPKVQTKVVQTSAPQHIEEYTDEMGRKFKVLVREGEDPSIGILVGPTPLDALGLPDEVNVRLHNELYSRGLLTSVEVKRNPNAVLAALQAALRVNVQQIQNAFDGVVKEDAS